MHLMNGKGVGHVSPSDAVCYMQIETLRWGTVVLTDDLLTLSDHKQEDLHEKMEWLEWV